MAIGATIFYLIESGHNPNVGSFLDALRWSVSTVTTVGNGDITPQTTPGKVLDLFMMIGGTALFSCFTAYFASMIFAIEIEEMDEEL